MDAQLPRNEVPRNEVLGLLQADGLDPSEFEWREVTTEATQYGGGWTQAEKLKIDALIHRPTRAYFFFDYNENAGVRYVSYFPGTEQAEDSGSVGDWAGTLQAFRQWVSNLKREYNSPDLWAELQRQRDALGAGARGEDLPNSPFTPEEQETIAAQLTEAKEYVRANFELEPSQLERIEAQLDYLVEASKRVGRIDWRNLLVGSFLSLVLQAAIPPEPVQQLLFIVMRGLAGMFLGGSPEFPGGPPELV